MWTAHAHSMCATAWEDTGEDSNDYAHCKTCHLPHSPRFLGIPTLPLRNTGPIELSVPNLGYFLGGIHAYFVKSPGLLS
jgi:hypothetical protein